MSSISSCTPANQSYSAAVDQLFKAADANSDGKITKSELTQAVETDRVDLGSNSQSDIDVVFNYFDSGDKGYITKQDAAEGLAKIDALTSSSTAGTPPAARGGGGGAGGGGGTSSTSSATLDPADTNGDGEVSAQEELAYLLKQYAAGESTDESQISVQA